MPYSVNVEMVTSIFQPPTYTTFDFQSKTKKPRIEQLLKLGKPGILVGLKCGFIFLENNKKNGLSLKFSTSFKLEKYETSINFTKNVTYLLILYLESFEFYFL